MPRKSRKHAHQDARLEMVEHIAEQTAGEVKIFAEFRRDPASSPELLDYAWDNAARVALKIVDRKYHLFAVAGGGTVRHELPPDYIDTRARDLRRTFERFKLDPDDPWSWRTLAEYMSLLFSGPQSKRGRRTEWPPERLLQLHHARNSPELKSLPDSEAAYRLANDKGSSFYVKGTDRKAGVEGLRKNIRKAARMFGTK
jgi:hypothetical protein